MNGQKDVCILLRALFLLVELEFGFLVFKFWLFFGCAVFSNVKLCCRYGPRGPILARPLKRPVGPYYMGQALEWAHEPWKGHRTRLPENRSP
jgi:hypothetical protein